MRKSAFECRFEVHAGIVVNARRQAAGRWVATAMVEPGLWLVARGRDEEDATGEAVLRVLEHVTGLHPASEAPPSQAGEASRAQEQTEFPTLTVVT